VLLIETDGFEQEIVERDLTVLQDICKKNKATEIKVAKDNEERTHLWKVRKALSPAMHAKAPYKTNEDICVPITKLPEILEKTYAIGAKANIPTLCFGHAGDGNIHVNFMTHTQFDPVVEQAVHDMFIATVGCGGTISGEHGIGLSKAPFIQLELGETERKVHKQIKQLFDPNNILNPGKFIEYC
jgi:FAD/FMN-containing dehydrogenase